MHILNICSARLVQFYRGFYCCESNLNLYVFLFVFSGVYRNWTSDMRRKEDSLGRVL